MADMGEDGKEEAWLPGLPHEGIRANALAVAVGEFGFDLGPKFIVDIMTVVSCVVHTVALLQMYGLYELFTTMAKSAWAEFVNST